MGQASLAADGAGVVVVTFVVLATVVGVVAVMASVSSVTVGVAIVVVSAIVGAGFVDRVGAGVVGAIGAWASSSAWWSPAPLLPLS